MPDIKIAELLVNVGSSSGGLSGFITTIGATFLGAGLAFGTNWYFESKKYSQRVKEEEEKIKQERINHLFHIFIMLSGIKNSLCNFKRESIVKKNKAFEVLAKEIKGLIEKFEQNLMPLNKSICIEGINPLLNTILTPEYFFSVEMDKCSFISKINPNISLLLFNIKESVSVLNNASNALNKHLDSMRVKNQDHDLNDFNILYCYIRNLRLEVDNLLYFSDLAMKCLNRIDKDFKYSFELHKDSKELIPIDGVNGWQTPEGWEDLEKWAEVL